MTASDTLYLQVNLPTRRAANKVYRDSFRTKRRDCRDPGRGSLVTWIWTLCIDQINGPASFGFEAVVAERDPVWPGF